MALIVATLLTVSSSEYFSEVDEPLCLRVERVVEIILIIVPDVVYIL